MKSLYSVSLLVVLLVCLSLTSMAAPTVSSISPTSGPTTGGTSVTITGTNFVSGAKVTFGGTAATGVSVVSSTTTLLPDQSGTTHPHLSFTGGKEGNFFLLDRDNLGKYQTSDLDPSAVQVLPLGAAWSSPAYWNNLVYVGTNAHALRAFRLSSGLLSGPVSQSARSFGYPGVTPVVSANGTSNGIVWILEKSSTNQDVFLHAYNATNLSSELYNSTQVASRDTIGAGTRFEIPLVANGRVYMGTGGSTPQLQIFGMIP